MIDLKALYERVQKTNPEITENKIREEIGKSEYGAKALIISTADKNSVDKQQIALYYNSKY